MFPKSRLVIASLLTILALIILQISLANAVEGNYLTFLPLIQQSLDTSSTPPPPTPTLTATFSCLSPFCTPPPSITPNPTFTLTNTSTPTITNTPSPKQITHTPSPTPTANCPIYASPFVVEYHQLFFNLTNTATLDTFEISSVFISWPDTPTQNLTTLDLESNIFWTGTQATSPFSQDSGWIGPDFYRQIPPFTSRILTFTFSETLPPYSYLIQIGFTNGCSIALSN